MSRYDLARALIKPAQPVFYFHRVGQDQEELYPEGLSADLFARSLQHLLDKGFVFTSLTNAQAGAGGNRRAVLSADDGFSCLYHDVLPIIRELGIPLTVFVIGKCIDNRALAWNHKLIQIRHHASDAELATALNELQASYSLSPRGSIGHRLFSVPDAIKDDLCDELWQRFCPISQEDFLARKQPFLSLAQMCKLQQCGVEFALHSHSHADFGRLSFPRMREELSQNREALSEAGFDPAPFFAFPYGRECSSDLLPALCRDLELEACLGFRYRSMDNHPQSLLWQRISLEHSPLPAFKELMLRPALRRLKDTMSDQKLPRSLGSLRQSLFPKQARSKRKDKN